MTDPSGAQWNIHRRWWPFPDLTDVFDLDVFVLSLIVWLPFVILWPFWYAAKCLGVRWRIVVQRDNRDQGSELVRGYRRSGERINQIALQIAHGHHSGHQSGQFLL